MNMIFGRRSFRPPPRGLVKLVGGTVMVKLVDGQTCRPGIEHQGTEYVITQKSNLMLVP